MTHVLLKKIKWLISILGLIGLICISSIAIVSCSSSSEPPKQEITPPTPEQPNTPEFDTLDQELEWLWNDNLYQPIYNYFASNPNQEITIEIINDIPKFNSIIIFNLSQFGNGNAKTRFLDLMKESSVVGNNYLQITDDKKGILIPGFENSPLYGPWGNPADDNWPSLEQAQLRWIRNN